MKYYKGLRRKNTSYLQLNEGRLSGLVHVLRRNSLLKHVTEGQLEETGRRERRRKQLLDEFKEGKI